MITKKSCWLDEKQSTVANSDPCSYSQYHFEFSLNLHDSASAKECYFNTRKHSEAVFSELLRFHSSSSPSPQPIQKLNARTLTFGLSGSVRDHLPSFLPELKGISLASCHEPGHSSYFYWWSMMPFIPLQMYLK